jgi:hypothetical protein
MNKLVTKRHSTVGAPDEEGVPDDAEALDSVVLVTTGCGGKSVECMQLNTTQATYHRGQSWHAC